MKILAGLLLLIPIWAQDQAKPADSAPAQAAATAGAQAPTPTQDQAKAAEPAAPAPASRGEDWIQGSVRFGYRWIPSNAGSFDTYRSVVNLGEGPKLFDADLTLLNRSKRVFDRADIQMSSWGDPYNTLRADITKDNSYRLTIDYRNINYFNFLPSYADPTLNQGVLLDQNSFDTKIRSFDVLLEAHRNKWITPYLGYSFNEQDGRGITDFHTDINEYPVASMYSDMTNNYRGGVRMELGAYHVTLEQGGTKYREDQGASNANTIPGNFQGNFLGKQLRLNNLSELYRVRGDSIYTKGLVAANPYSWMAVTGQFIYAKPSTDISYTAASAGTFYLQQLLQFYSFGQDILSGDANMPHVTGSVTVELRPLRRLRIVEYWMTDRFHNASNALLAQSVLLTSGPHTDSELLNDRLVVNSNREEVDAYYDLTSRLTLRGGYRYEWGDSTVRAPILTGLKFESADLRRHVGIAGFNFRIGQKFRLSGDAEGSSSGEIYFRTSLQDYQKAHIRARYDLSPQWRFAGDFSLLYNNNPSPNIKLDYSAEVESVSVQYTPKAVKWANALVDYARSSVFSNIMYLVPNTLSPTPSIYHENGHSLSALATVKWVAFGGSLYISSGSRPTKYYQPLVRLTVPLHKHVEWISEWRWYSMNESFYAFENFQSNQFVTSLRLIR